MMKIKGKVVPETAIKRNIMAGKERKNKAIQATEHFAQSSGIHGIRHITRHSKARGVIWSVICAASFGN